MRFPFIFPLWVTVSAVVLLLPGSVGCHRSAPAAKETAPAAEPTQGAADTKAAEEELPTIEVARVQTGTAEKTVPLTGTLTAYRDRQAALSPPVAGIVDALPVRVGQKVTRGQTVLHLSTRTLEGQIAQAQAAIRQNEIQVQQAEVNALQQQGQTRSGILQAQTAVSGAQATLLGAQSTLAGSEAALTNARQQLARTQALFKEGLVAQKDVEAADLAVRSAEAQVNAQRQAVAAQRDAVRGQEQAAQAARTNRFTDTARQKDIAIARQQLAGAKGALAALISQRAQYTVRAPLTGTVTAVAASIGESIDPTTKAVSLADVSRLQLQIAVPSASLEAVQAGQRLAFKVDALSRRSFYAVIRTVSKQVDAASGTVTAIADVANPGQVLKDGMFARVQVVTARHPNALLLSRAAVLFDPNEGASVLKVGADGKVHKTPVTTGWVSGDRIEITSGGLHSGDQIATTGAFGLEDGAEVQVAEKTGTREP